MQWYTHFLVEINFDKMSDKMRLSRNNSLKNKIAQFGV